jgi:antitoxin component of MazEF toxin-antitoxin module
MEAIKEKIKQNGDFHIPKAIMERLKLKIGEEVNLRIEGNKLIIEPEKIERKKLKIKSETIDDLVENEELFEPETM